ARRAVLGVATDIPVYVVDDSGRAQRRGTLSPVHPGFLFVDDDDQRRGAYDFGADLRWFLDDLRPSGFLGRLVPRRHPELELPDDVRRWTADHVLRFITRYGHDLVGNVVVGDAALSRWHTTTADIVDVDDYPRLAALELTAGTSGSSAGGEQPKLLARRRDDERQIHDVLVKWSPPLDNDVARRVGELLVCEHHALQALATTGVATSSSRLVERGAQIFLDVQRFDRVGARGRRGLVSLGVLDDAFVGARSGGWPTTTSALVRLRRIDADAHRHARIAALFGAFIANSDMHHGNLSFFVDEQLRLAGLAPIYDMLPMRYAPVAGQLVERRIEAVAVLPDDDDIADVVVAAARLFWQAVVADARIGASLTTIARAHLATAPLR
ncbi:MAG TPA: HipA domain-containing protein, partial [Myxococcota bacterium]